MQGLARGIALPGMAVGQETEPIRTSSCIITPRIQTLPTIPWSRWPLLRPLAGLHLRRPPPTSDAVGKPCGHLGPRSGGRRKCHHLYHRGRALSRALTQTPFIPSDLFARSRSSRPTPRSSLALQLQKRKRARLNVYLLNRPDQRLRSVGPSVADRSKSIALRRSVGTFYSLRNTLSNLRPFASSSTSLSKYLTCCVNGFSISSTR